MNTSPFEKNLKHPFEKQVFPIKSKWNLLPGLAIIFLVFIIYGSSIGYPFVWTDHAEVEQGALVPKTAGEFLSIFTKPKGEAISTARSAFQTQTKSSSGRYAYFRPIKALTYWIDYYIGSKKPWSFHLTNMLIHIATCLMIILLLSQIVESHSRGLAWAAALIHAVNPLNVETVSWISARSDSMVAFFTLCALWMSLRARNTKKPKALLLQTLAGTMAVFALWSKESGIIAVPIMAVLCFSLDYQGIKKGIVRILKMCWLPMLMVVLALAWRFIIVADIHLSQFGHKHGLGLWTILHLFGHNLWMSFFPSGMTVADTVVTRHGPSLAAIVGPLAWLSWFSVGIWNIKKQPIVLIGALAWLISIGPVSQLLPLIHPRGDRYLYLPAIFAASSLAWIFFSLYETIATKKVLSVFSISAFVFLILILSFFSENASEKWSDEKRLFVESLLLQPNCIECWNNLAYAQAIKGNLQGAAYSCSTALSIDRSKYRGAKDGFSLRWILSKVLLEEKKGSRAAAVLEEMIFALGPNPGLLKMLALAYLQAHRPAHALAAAQLALELSPSDQSIEDLADLATALEIKLEFPLLFSNPESCIQ